MTGVPLLAAAVCALLVAVVATGYGWRRTGRERFLIRPAGVLLTEALALLVVGLAVNASEGFYPSWAALAPHHEGTTAGQTVPGRLDPLLGQRAGADDGAAVTITWQPDGWQQWHLAAPPVVVVPAGYLRHPGWRYPAIVVEDQAGAGQPAAPDAVLVCLRTAGARDAGILATRLPRALAADLRVTAHSWALVTPAGQAALDRAVLLADPARYRAVALLATDRRPAGPAMPTGTDTTVVRAARGAATTAALRWAGQRIPAPLAAPAALAPYQKSAGPRPGAAPTGGGHGTGQPRR
ncbi:hypothetical protein DMB66_33415 [Actinoplanes sp. ATCC 53533]|nr:hypothetical protein DMB66_33415 [Actinoplanes sp. ATCC 53533]